MLMLRPVIRAMLCVLALTLSSQPQAAPMVLFGVEDLGGGLFQYDLTLNNSGGTEPLSGLLVLNGGSVFGLDASSNIGAPQDVGGNPAADWSFLAPFPPFVDILSYFSLDPAADVPIDGFQGGFSFQSFTAPQSLTSEDFSVVGIGALSATEIPLSTQFVSEPATLVLVLLAVVGWIASSGRAHSVVVIRRYST
jgi:hypothetical protein